MRWPSLARPVGAGVERRSAVLAVVLSGLFTVSFTITVLSNSLDRIAVDLGSTRSVMLWSITGPMLAFGVVGPAFGKAGDMWGHRRVFIAGLAGASVFAALTAVAWSAGSMIAFRTLSATAGAATGPAAMAYINRMYSSTERVRPLGYWSFVAAGAPVIGVVLGAPLVAQLGWRVIFAAQAPLCAIGVVIAARLLPETDRGAGHRFDVGGAATLGLGAAVALVAVNRGNEWGWTDRKLLGCAVAAAILLGAFVAIERRVRDPLLPLVWLRRPMLMGAVGAQSLGNFAYMGSFMLAPSLLQNGLGYSETLSGLVLIARPTAFALAASRAGVVNRLIGERRSIIFGSALIVVSMLAFASIGSTSGTFPVVVALGLAGVGMGVASPAAVATVANSVDDHDLGVAGAMQQLMAQLGAVLGAEVMQSVQASGGASAGSLTGFTHAFLTAAGVALVGCVLAVRLVRPSRRSNPGVLIDTVSS